MLEVLKLEPLYIAERNIKWAVTWKSLWQVLKLNRNSTTRIIPKRNVNICPDKNIYRNVHSDIIHNNQKMEIIQMAIN